MRKPGEPIYLRKHLLALVATVVATVAVPRLYEMAVGPLTLEGQFLFGLVVAVLGGVGLTVVFRPTSENEGEKKD